MLKDYYKILGVHEDAPEKEIRARWIELMKHYHPDVQKGIEFDEISKEINEAYEILKDPFTRAEYDHDLAQNRCYRRKKVGDRLSFVLLGSVFFAAIIYMAIIPRITSVSSVSQSIRRNLAKVHSESDVSRAELEAKAKAQAQVEVEKNSINPTDSMNPINQPKPEVEVQVQKNSINPTDPSNPITQPKPEVEDNQTNQRNQTDQRNQQKVEAKVKKSPTSPSNTINSSNQPKAKAEVENNQINQTNQRNQTNQINQRNQDKVKVQKNPLNPKDSSNPITQAKPEAKVQDNQKNQIDQTNQRNQRNQRNQINSLVAREEEIKKFFANYVDRYNRKDLIGFMSFFSNRAIQNQKDGLEAIKKIYFTFFNQSLELKYRLSDPKIEICQNAINVKAQYELDQLSRNGRRNAFRGCVQWVLAREGEGLKIVSLDYQQTKGESHEI